MPENTKKFLWLAGAVSLFALLVIGAAFILFAPSKTSTQVPFDLKGTAEPKQESPQDFLANTPADTGTTQTTSSSGDIIIVYGNNPETKSGAAPVEAQQKPASTTIVVAPPSTPTTIKPAGTPKASPVAPAAKTVVQPVAKAPSAPSPTIAPSASVKPKAAPAAAAPAKTAAPKPVAQVSAGNYWIQAGSFSVKDNADALKSSLIDKALPTTISVRDTDGKSRYLVKIGPYTTREEANTWLPSVKSVKGAEKAWITQ